jgi:hypothetical protein
VAARRHPKDVLEMLGDFFRDAAVLLLIFYPLEMARTNNGSLSLPFILIVGAVCIGLLLMGIVFEKMRGQ